MRYFDTAFVGCGPDAAAFSPSSICWLTRHSANSAATRMAFLIALALDRPWQMMQTPLDAEQRRRRRIPSSPRAF